MDLDELDRQLAHALQIDGRAPFSRIAAVLGTTDRTLARRYERLRSNGVLRVVGLPHAAALGHVDWLVRMRCAPDAAMPVASALAQRADTSWVLILSGGTEINCITRTRRQQDEGELLLQKLPRTSGVAAVSAHCMLRSVAGTSGWPGRTAALDAAQVAALTPPAATGGDPVRATTADNQLLAELAKDGRASFPALAAATGWSESTVRRRLEALQHGGVLYFDVDVEPATLGFTAEAALWLTVDASALNAVGRALAEHPQIAYAAAVTGPSNIAAAVVCRDLDGLYDYLADGIGALPGVHRTETAPVVRRLKGAGTLLVP
ncbi:Lrp/AsnC family transcriptional regulator [Cryptosporangium arvum]|uniref:Transcriptional regulator n=1 Tax=Cryptosporangium arvum DSM 44712 TaxID=927661 RepID=A0A010ZQ64_9ACTN|nr:Lrp/AsnC family transcriptional regulator [Cryptosporangium arvum]EXG80794.1 transcriptional regulator [Cryptosporangium arvum DSM 44712]